MPFVQQFAYGPVNPIVAFLTSLVGLVLGFTCAARARTTLSPGRKVKWLALSALCLGVGGIWLMQFMAMLGFDVSSRTIRFDVWLTLASLAIAIASTAVGVFIVGWGRASIPTILGAGVLTGSGLVATHYVGVAAMDFGGSVSYDRSLAFASMGIAFVAAIATLWCAVSAWGWKMIATGSTAIAVAISAAHYTGMAAMRVRLDPNVPGAVHGVDPVLLVLPITVVITVALMMGLLFSALSMMTDEEFSVELDNTRSTAAPVSPAGARTHGYYIHGRPTIGQPHTRELGDLGE